ncbi:MAG: GTP 3',8-cyclase MoaA [Blastomonas sp.]
MDSAQTRIPARPALIDGHDRRIDYVRLSVTDRCDLRCSYCMPERMQFLPRREVLSLEEIHRLALEFIARGVRKIRLTGGEPLVRRDIMDLVRAIGREIGSGGLDELTLTTNGTQLATHAEALADAGIRRINVSLDTRDPALFAQLSRRDALDQVMTGLDSAKNAGLAIKINTVALRGLNEAEIPELIRWAHGEGHELTLIEVMPLGEVEQDRIDHYLPLTAIYDQLRAGWTLTASDHNSGGPARYYDIAETGGRLGLITPLTQNFCAGCNRVRVTATGQIYMCLGQSDRIDLRAALRGSDSDAALQAALDMAMRTKPERHSFDISRRGAAPAVSRHMSVTGG